MQNAVRFGEPARLRIYEIDQRPAGEGAGAVLKRIGADAVGRSGAMRIDQCLTIADQHGGFDGSDVKRDGVLQRNRGADLDGVREIGESLAPDLEAINSKREAFREQVALTVCFEVLVE